MNIRYWIVTVCVLSQVNASRIFAFFPYPDQSHQRLFHTLIRQLVINGHHVTAMLPFPVQNPPQGLYTEMVIPGAEEKLNSTFVKKEQVSSTSVKLYQNKWISLIESKEVSLKYCENLLTDPMVQSMIKSKENFDMVLLESTFLQESLIAFGHKFKAPVVEVLPVSNMIWSNWLVGNPTNPSYIVDHQLPYSDHMNFWERTHNALFSGFNIVVSQLYYMPKHQELINKYFKYPGSKKRPYITDMLSNISLVLVNSHPALNYPYPKAQHVIEIGGLQHYRPSTLPKGLQNTMDRATRGVIYCNLGSLLQVPQVIHNDLLTVLNITFASLPQQILLKWEIDPLPQMASNIKVRKRFPQPDLLAHKNTVLFISHGGLDSVSEAVNFGVPMIGIPILEGQEKNVAQMTHAGYGLQLDFDNVTVSSLSWAIKEILNNTRYKTEAKARSAEFMHQSSPGLERAMFWIGFILRNRNSRLRSPATQMYWFQTNLLDVLAFMFMTWLATCSLGYFTFKCLRSMCVKTSHPTTEQNKKLN